MVQPKPQSRPSPFATGLLSEKPLAQLLVYVLDRRLTGSFELLGEGGSQTQIAIESGMVARVATSEAVAYLGLVLYEMGAIDGGQLSQSLAEVAQTKQLHGQVLLARRMVAPEGLAEGLRRQRARKLHHAFELPPKTRFAFYLGFDLVGERPNDVEPMDPVPAIWRGVLLHPPWEHVHATLTTVGERPLKLVGAVERLGLEGKELETVERMGGTPVTCREVAGIAGLDPKLAELLAYFLVISKMAELGRRPTAADASGPVSSPAPVSNPKPVSPLTSLPSGQYPRPLSFTMRAVRTDREPLRIPSPMPSAMQKTPGESRVPIAPTSSPSLKAPPADGGQKSVEAEHAVSQAEMHFVLGENAQAIQSARRAVALDRELPEASALLAYFQAIGLDPDEDAYIQDSLSLVNRALLKKETCRRGHYYRAEIKKRLEDHEGAIRDLRIAVAQDPNDVEARRELRVYEQKVSDGSITLGLGSSGSNKTSKGLLDRLRGK
jgi:tetratricopeptide (TPR) repeat protein